MIAGVGRGCAIIDHRRICFVAEMQLHSPPLTYQSCLALPGRVSSSTKSGLRTDVASGSHAKFMSQRERERSGGFLFKKFVTLDSYNRISSQFARSFQCPLLYIYIFFVCAYACMCVCVCGHACALIPGTRRCSCSHGTNDHDLFPASIYRVPN